MSKFLFILCCFTLSLSSFASCVCKTNETSKVYQERSRTWYGMKVKFSCIYDCTNSDGQTERIEGFHSKKIIGQEKGNEIICDGTIYQEQYSTATNWFYWKYIGNKPFDPKESDSSTLREWAEAHYCR